uniref:GATOR complex protein NPRL2 n=1 Tax=Panagrellus redivivus TaxID=6233 RepID=A0A7E4VUV5_PANRE
MLCYFDNTYGPQMRCSFPPQFIDKPFYDTINRVIIVHKTLCHKMIKFEAKNLIIMGNPVCIVDTVKYDRNQILFNLCFAIEKTANIKSEQMWEPILQKAADYLIELEKECSFISKPNRANDAKLLEEMFKGLTSPKRQCYFQAPLSRTVVALRVSLPYVFETKHLPPDNAVPAFARAPLPTDVNEQDFFNKMDMVSQKVVWVMDGVASIADIAYKAHIPSEIVGRCVKQLIYCGVVVLLPQFLYSNYYYTTEKFAKFVESVVSQEECCRFVRRKKKKPAPEPRDILELYAGLRPSWKLAFWAQHYRPRLFNVDERKLIQFGIFYGIVRKQNVYPVASVAEESELLELCNGSNTVEEIATEMELSSIFLLRCFECSPKVTLLIR